MISKKTKYKLPKDKTFLYISILVNVLCYAFIGTIPLREVFGEKLPGDESGIAIIFAGFLYAAFSILPAAIILYVVRRNRYIGKANNDIFLYSIYTNGAVSALGIPTMYVVGMLLTSASQFLGMK